MESFDVIIVGTGPAGASAALALVGSGLDVLVLEQATLPRHKPCGGALPGFAKDLLDIDFSPVVTNRTEMIRIQNNYLDEVTVDTVGDRAPLLVNRAAFDSFLIDRAAQLGRGKIVLRTKSRAVFEEENSEAVLLRIGKSERLKAKFLIASDGASSRIAAAVGLLPQRNFSRAFEADVRVEESYYEDCSGMMVMNLFCVPHGYGWIFPKETGRLSCGVVTWGEAANLRKELDEFIRRSIPNEVVERINVTGHFIPIYQGSEQIATRRVLLAGDAAALVDPVSGEGIRHALLSGKLAASAITEELANSDRSTYGAADLYQKSVDERIGKELSTKRKFAYLAFHASPDFFYKTFVKGIQNIPHFS